MHDTLDYFGKFTMVRPQLEETNQTDRLICGKSCNVEEQERVFNTITNITKTTSSNHPSHIIGNEKQKLYNKAKKSGKQSNWSKFKMAIGNN